MHYYEDNLEELKLLCDAELINQRVHKEFSISQDDLREEILYRYLDELMSTDDDANRTEVESLVKRIVNHKRYHNTENIESVRDLRKKG